MDYQPFTCFNSKGINYLFENVVVDNNNKLYYKKGEKLTPIKSQEMFDKVYYYVKDINHNKIMVYF